MAIQQPGPSLIGDSRFEREGEARLVTDIVTLTGRPHLHGIDS